MLSVLRTIAYTSICWRCGKVGPLRTTKAAARSAARKVGFRTRAGRTFCGDECARQQIIDAESTEHDGAL